MAVHTMQRKCKTCGAPRLFEKQGINNILHLLLCIPTAGLWLLMWILLAVLNAFEPYRCKICGQSKYL